MAQEHEGGLMAGLSRRSGRSWVVSRAAVIAAPLLAVLASCADVVLIFAGRGPNGGALTGPSVRNAALTTVPLSIIAGAWTLYMLIKLRREVVRSEGAERSLRTALSQRERALDREFAVRRELDHRVRNNLAGLVGLVAVYERSGRTSAQLGEAIRAKIEAMRGVHDIASRAGGGPVDLQSLLALVAESIVPLPRRAGMVFGGPEMPIAMGQAGAMAMILQELCTNSLKHGALAAEGRVRVHWVKSLHPEGVMLTLSWEERGVPEPGALGARRPGGGVGLELIRGFAQTDLRGEFRATRGDGTWTVELRVLLARPSRHDYAAAAETGAAQEVCV